MAKILFLDRLHVKLFLAIFATNAALALAAYLAFSSSFDRGFVESLQQADELRLHAFAAALGERYEREHGWDWIAKDPERWTSLSRQALGLPVRGSGDSQTEQRDRKSTRLNSSHIQKSRMPSSA